MQSRHNFLHLNNNNGGINILLYFHIFAAKPGDVEHIAYTVDNLSGCFNCDTVVQQLALSPHTKYLWVLVTCESQACVCFYFVCVGPLCV